MNETTKAILDSDWLSGGYVDINKCVLCRKNDCSNCGYYHSDYDGLEKMITKIRRVEERELANQLISITNHVTITTNTGD